MTTLVKPVWQTTEGSLGSFVQGIAITPVQLSALNASTYELLSGKIPSGLKLNSDNGRITGTPIDTNLTKLYSFVIRASNESGVAGAKVIQDRSFTITIQSGSAPELLTPEGTLNIGTNNESYVLNDSTVNFQFQASATSIPVGQELKFYIEEGSSNLPPGLKLSKSGLLYGTIKDDLELDFKVVNGSYDKDFYDANPYDYGSNIEPATGITAVSLNGHLTGATLTYGGYGYLLDPEVIVGGSIDTITITNNGTGYTVVPDIEFSPSPVSGGLTAKGYAVINNGQLSSIVVTNAGTGYVVPPTIFIKEKDTGTGAVATCNLTSGSGAVIVARVRSGSIEVLEIESVGQNYTSAPLISFGLPTIGPRILSKTYRFSVTVSNGELTDTKIYSIFVNSEDTLRADTTFISSDSVNYDSSSTYIQSPIWVTSSILPNVKGNNNITIDLEVFDPTPTVGNLVFTLLDSNFDGTPSQFGPLDVTSKNAFPYNTHLSLDSVGGEITGSIPYQPAITRSYVFTVQCARYVDDVEVVSTFKQFILTVEGNIESVINFITPSTVGTLTPNQQSLLKVVAESSLPSASVNYQLVPGYGRTSSQDYIELTLLERNGKVLIDGYGIEPTLTLEKGQAYKINVNLINFTASFKTLNNDYYNTGLRHSDNTVGANAQEKNTGYFIFNVPFDSSEKIKLTYTNIKTDGLFIVLKKYNEETLAWERQEFKSFFSEYDANIYFNNTDAIAYFLKRNQTQFTIKKFNTSTLVWDTLDIATTKATSPTNGDLWLDLDSSSFGILEFRYSGISGGWFSVNVPVVTAAPITGVGADGAYVAYNVGGTYSVYRKVNGIWKIMETLSYSAKSSFDPNLFIKAYNKTAPITNLQYDVWWKYNTPFDGFDNEVTVVIRELGNIPSELSLSLNGEIIGKVSPGNEYVYRSEYIAGRSYSVNDIITFRNTLYRCISQYVSSGVWLNDLGNWSLYTFPKKLVTTVDQTIYGSNAWQLDTGETTIDGRIRFRVRAKDSQNVSYTDKDFDIVFNNTTNKTYTNIYLQPLLNKSSRDLYFNFITDPNVFLNEYIYRSDDTNFGVQRTPKMLLLGGIESTLADRYVSAVVQNYYDRPLYFGDIKTAIAKNADGITEYELVYVEIVDPYEINGVSVSQKIKLPFAYDIITADYSKLRIDDTTSVTDLSDTSIGLDTIYPSSITLMQKELENVTLERTGSFASVPVANIEDWGTILDFTTSEDWGLVAERVTVVDDFLLVIETLAKDNTFRPLWMNTSQDGSGLPIGFVKAVPICYVKPGNSDKIVSIINKNGFDFKQLNFTIDRLIIQNPQGETGDKYIKFINREII